MHVNEQVKKGQKGTRPPDMELAFDDARATRGSRTERRGTGESRRAGTQPATTRLPPSYGAGF
jgi:hypothetical protein